MRRIQLAICRIQARDSNNPTQETMMIRYQASIPRAACGLAAIAMTALVFGLLVVLPATIDTNVDDYATAGCTPSPAADAA